MRSGLKLLRPVGEPPLDVSTRATLGPAHARYFGSDGAVHRLVRELARARAVPVKEAFESFEFFERARRHVRAERIADLCCGHGLTGVLFAAFERRVERVDLVDRRIPASAERVLEAVRRVAPWVDEKVVLHERRLRGIEQELAPGTGVVAVHACGLRTDRCLDVALALGGPLAVMPCCYPEARSEAPPTLVQHLGAEIAFDVDRTYRLERAGYRVRWDAVPAEITPMARMLVATLREERG